MHTVTVINATELEFERMIGRGTFGQVFKGSWKGMTVALKKIIIPSGSDASGLPREVEVLRFVL